MRSKMYKAKDLLKGILTLALMFAFLAGFLTLNGLHYAGAL